jgi:hypothetical protein
LEEQPIMVCVRADPGVLYAPGSVLREASCDHRVWLSPSGVEIAKEQNCRLLCDLCAKALAREQPDEVKVAALRPKQIAELKAAGIENPTDQELLDFLLGRWR